MGLPNSPKMGILQIPVRVCHLEKPVGVRLYPSDGGTTASICQGCCGRLHLLHMRVFVFPTLSCVRGSPQQIGIPVRRVVRVPSLDPLVECGLRSKAISITAKVEIAQARNHPLMVVRQCDGLRRIIRGARVSVKRLSPVSIGNVLVARVCQCREVRRRIQSSVNRMGGRMNRIGSRGSVKRRGNVGGGMSRMDGMGTRSRGGMGSTRDRMGSTRDQMGLKWIAPICGLS